MSVGTIWELCNIALLHTHTNKQTNKETRFTIVIDWCAVLKHAGCLKYHMILLHVVYYISGLSFMKTNLHVLTCWAQPLTPALGRFSRPWGAYKLLTTYDHDEVLSVLFSGNGKVALVDSRTEKQLQGWYTCHERSVRTVQIHPLKQQYFITSSALW
jgi:hypothetical protein